ncbi:MAG: transporter [Gordonia sp. (in: high G+C Gram-positive bacteria)]|uniref:PH-like domain-containing protein n=1 Tax=Gordonia sp. (in: high G+C Gram-positive bacteria) TaxID=84139 RepID=UPI0039E4FB40
MSPWLADTIIIAVVLLIWLSLVALALRGWRRRGRAQAEVLGDPPVVPAELGERLLGPETGIYLGSTVAPGWVTRVALRDFGDRSAVAFSRHPGGILLERRGAEDIWIADEAIVAVRTENRHGGKVMTRDGILAIRWRLPSGVEIDSGLRGDDKSAYPAWTQAYSEVTEATFAELEAAAAEKGAGTKRKKS